MQHYREVRAERSRQGLAVPSLNVKIEDHPLIGRKLRHREDDRVFTVEAVHKKYEGGWYFAIAISHEGSLGVRCWANINCMQPHILDQIRSVDLEFELLPERK